MNIVWFNEKPKDGVATIYEGNITLNKSAIEFFENCYSVMLGVDYEKKLVYIKPLSKEQDLRGDIPENQKYRITIRSSYGRISNKEFIKELIYSFDLDLANGPEKFPTTWDSNNFLLKIDMNKECE